MRFAPTAPKPPVAENWTWPAPVPTAREKSPTASSTAPPARLRLSRPPVTPLPPGRELAVVRRTAPAVTRVWPVYLLVPASARTPKPVLVRPPVPVRLPERTASTKAEPLATSTVRWAAPK